MPTSSRCSAAWSAATTIDRSAITGNAIRGLYAYGAGAYSDGGGIGKSKTLRVTNSTIARNLAEPAPGLPAFLLQTGFWRGGGIYMSNGSLEIKGATIVENVVRGVPHTDSLGRRNLAGGIAATVGNAHAVEGMTIGQSIVAGNTVQEINGAAYGHDLFTGSLMYFHSEGYNRFGVMDFSQILVPVGEPRWASLCRRHFPKQGDASGVVLAGVVDLVGGVTVDATIPSAGADAGAPVVLYYAAAGSALAQVPAQTYRVAETLAEYSVAAGATDDFLEIVLERIERHYGLTGFAASFKAEFEAFLQSVDSDATTAGVQPYRTPTGAAILTLADTQWFGPAQTWPRELYNYPYIEFWHRLDAALGAAGIAGLGPEVLGDAAWQALFAPGRLAENQGITMTIYSRDALSVTRLDVDQQGTARPTASNSDIGAIEAP